MSSQRIRSVGESIREILGAHMTRLKDPRIGFVTITDVRLSGDLREAEVFYTVLPDDEDARERTAEGLASATPVLRRELGARLRIRHVPDIRFVEDPLPEQGRRIEELLRRHPPAGEPDEDL